MKMKMKMKVKNFFENKYAKFPLFMQNIFVSAQGYLFKRQRFSKGFYEQLALAIDRSKWSKEELESYQLKRARTFLRHAQETSAYWRQKFGDKGVSWEDLDTIQNIRKFPILEKDDLRNHANLIRSSLYAVTSMNVTHTSGTSGKSITVWSVQKDIQERQALLFRMFNLFGVAPFEKSVRFSGRTLFPNASNNRIFWRYNAASKQLLMSSYDLHPDNLQEYVNKLRDFEPKLIDGYPSSIFILAKFINQTNQSGVIKPKAVMTTAETLEEYQRIEISKAFDDCPVINQYASSEGAPFITQDLEGEMVVNIDSGIFEFVKPGTDIPAQPGELAEMLVTSFTTHGTPLIRYRIGDTVKLSEGINESSNWNMPTVKQVLGRQEDILYTKERGFIPSLNKVFASAPASIKEAQIVQVDIDLVLFKVVVDESKDFKPSDLDGPMRELRDRLGKIEIEVQFVNALERGPNGKLRAVVGSPEILRQYVI